MVFAYKTHFAVAINVLISMLYELNNIVNDNPGGKGSVSITFDKFR